MPEPRIDPAAVIHRLDVPQADLITPVQGGADALLWRVRIDDRDHALRVLRADRRRQAEREVAIFRALAGTTIPVPAVSAVTLDAPAPAYLMDWVEGRTLGDIMLDPGTDDATRQHLMIDFGRLQRLINERTSPGPPDDAPDWIERRGGRLAGQPNDESEGDRLLHLDYHPLNVLVRDDRIVAVLDWANATLGDPRYDRARTESILTFHPDPDGRLAPLLERAIADWRTGYAAPDDLPPEFRHWAGEAMLIDLSPRVGDPTVPWLTTDHLDRIRLSEWLR